MLLYVSIPPLLFPECYRGQDPESGFKIRYEIDVVFDWDRVFCCYNKIHRFDYIQLHVSDIKINVLSLQPL